MLFSLTIISVIILIFSVILHEVSHGAMADYLGDPTPRALGRLSLNPLRHIDWFGSIILPAILIISGSSFLVGWAKPVPFNPLNLRDKRYGSAKVAIAGPLANLLIALVFGLLLRFLPWGNFAFLNENSQLVFSQIVWLNLLLAIFNLTPIPPLDGSHILFAFLPSKWQKVEMILLQYGIFILIFYIFFIFPLLGSFLGFIFTAITGFR